MDFGWLYQIYGEINAQYDTGIKFDYIVLYIILCFCTIYFSSKLSQLKNEKSWFLPLLPYIIAFSLIEGVRYLRGTDYLLYSLSYLYDDEFRFREFLWSALRETLRGLHCSYWMQFFVFAFSWITGLIFFIKKIDRKYAIYILPIAIVFSLGGLENLIRQSFAFSFLLVAIAYLLEKKYNYALLFLVVAIFIHNATIILALFACFIYAIRKVKVTAVTYVIIYVIVVFLLGGNFFSIVMQQAEKLLQIIGGGLSVTAYYLTDFNRFLGADAYMDRYSRSVVTLLFSALFDIVVMVLSYKHLKHRNFQDSNTLFFYHLFCISNILLQFTTNFMVVRRIFTMFYMFAAFLIGYVMHEKPLAKGENVLRLYMFAYVVIFFIKNILLASNQLFLWDADGKYNVGL